MKAVTVIQWFFTILSINVVCYASATQNTQALIANTKGEVHPLTPHISGYSSTVMKDGRILIVGGTHSDGRPVKDANFFDVKQQRFFAAPALAYAHRGHFSLQLSGGQVVVAGGLAFDLNNIQNRIGYTPEVYSPTAKAWVQISDIKFDANDDVYAAELTDGMVLFVASNEQAIQGSTRADTKQYRAWLWNPELNTTSRKLLNAKARSHPTIVVLRDGRVLLTGGRPLIFEPEYRCEEIPAAHARAQGVANGDWCATHGTWTDVAQASTELWDSRTENISELPAVPLAAWGRMYSQQLHSGDVLIIDHTSARNGESYPAVIWSAENGLWRKIAGLSKDELLVDTQFLLEQPDGTLLGHTHRYSIKNNAWTPVPHVAHDASLLQLPDNKLIALSLSEPYLNVFNSTQQRWHIRSNSYLRTHGNAALALRDGRLLVVGSMSNGGPHQTIIQLWNPISDTWFLQDTAVEEALKGTQLVQMTSGDVLRVGIAAGGILQCRRWSPIGNTNTDWTDCGRLQLMASKPGPINIYARKTNWSESYNFALGALDDGRLLLVDGADHAQLFNEQRNEWIPVALNASAHSLIHGAPIRLPHALFRFRDMTDGAWVDASNVALRYQQAEAGAYKADMPWDANNHQWAYIFTDFRMGRNAALLPDGCAIALSGNSFRLFDTRTGQVTNLSAPTFNGNGASLAVLTDGTVAVVSSAPGIDDRNSGFFAERASCKGFASVASNSALVADNNNVLPTQSVTNSLGNTGKAGLIPIWQWLLSQRWIALALVVPLALYLLLKKVIRRASKYDQEVKIPHNVGFSLRLVFYGILGIIIGPMLWPQFLNNSGSSVNDDSNISRIPWYTNERQYVALPKDLYLPCRFVGFWEAYNVDQEPRAVFRYSMYGDGYLKVESIHNGIAREIVLKGNWAAYGNDIVWLDDARDAKLETNRIVSQDRSKFTVQRPDGQYRKFLLIADADRFNCVPDNSN